MHSRAGIYDEVNKLCSFLVDPEHESVNGGVAVLRFQVDRKAEGFFKVGEHGHAFSWGL